MLRVKNFDVEARYLNDERKLSSQLKELSCRFPRHQCTVQISTLSPEGGAVSWRFHGLLLSVCLSVHHVVCSAPWREGVKLWCSARRTGLIAWLRESMSRSYPSSRSAASQKVDEKVCFSFSSCWTARNGLYRPRQCFTAIFMDQD